MLKELKYPLILDLLKGIKFIHDLKYVLIDLKPTNIMYKGPVSCI